MKRPLRVLTVGMKPAINQALAARDDLEVFAMTQWETRRYREGPLEVLPYDMRSKLSRQAPRAVKAFVEELRPDVVQTYGSRPLAHTTRALGGMAGRPVVVSYRGVTSVPSRLRLEDWLTYLSPSVDAHACESQASMDGLLAAGIPREECFLTYNCLSRPVEARTTRECLAEFDIPEDAFVIASVGNFRRVKGADILLEAAKRLTDLADTYFLLLGEVRDRRVSRLAADPRIASRVRLAGYRTDAMEIASTADVFAMASRAEALCVGLLEAMSVGVCPIVSDAGGMKEAVRHGVDGLVFPKEDGTALAEAVRSLHGRRDRLGSMGRSARSRFQSMFAGPIVAKRFATAFTGPTARRAKAA